MKISPPSENSLSEYYKTYLKYIDEDDLLDALILQKEISDSFLKNVSIEKETFRYAENKWMLKEVVGHLCDTERILAYRALRISRNDKTPLEGFDENIYVPNSGYNLLSLSDIRDEKSSIRESNIQLFKNMTTEMIDRTGIANKNMVSVRALLFFIIAHERHHLKIIAQKYLQMNQ